MKNNIIKPTFESIPKFTIKKKYKILDLFAGCGGLEEGFLQTQKYEDVGAVEWVKPACRTLRKRLKTKWKIKDAKDRVINFDIQRIDELFKGCENDKKFGSHKGLDFLCKNGVDLIIGGPPCQEFSIAKRNIHDDNNYRNYLFKYYCEVVKRYKPKLFIFENVLGLLSCNVNGKKVTSLIKEEFDKIGYEIYNNLELAVVDSSMYDVPQSRIRVIIIGLNKKLFKNPQKSLRNFYNYILPKYRGSHKISCYEALKDLPPIYPLDMPKDHCSHTTPKCNITWHVPRFNNERDIDIFRRLALGKENYYKICKHENPNATRKHYFVLPKNKPSPTIIASLSSDYRNKIHYDYKQARAITVREAARLQSFDDDFDFVGKMSDAYRMIGNAVPPKLGKALGNAIFEFLQKENK